MLTPAFSAAFRLDFPDVLGSPVLVALSGGADSVALLFVLLEARPSLGCPIACAHVNHHARPTAGDDEQFCLALCARLGVKLWVGHLHEPPPRGSSREAWWRVERYRRLEVARQELGCAAVATAHTLEDQAETVLYKMLRGSGPRGVAGIRPRRGCVIRPLLDFSGTALRQWLQARTESWCEDASNADPTQPRAWLRHQGLPALERRFPGSRRHLAGIAAMLQADEAHFATLLGTLPRPLVGRPVDLDTLRRLDPALQRRWLLAVADDLPLGEPPGQGQLAAWEELLAGSQPTAVDLGRHWVLRRREDRLWLCPPNLRPFSPRPAGLPSQEVLPGGFVCGLGVHAMPGKGIVHHAWLAPQIRTACLLWRAPQPGEEIGWGGGERQVSRRLAGLGVPPEWRRAWPVLEADGRIAWIPGAGAAPGWDGVPGDGVWAAVEEPWKRHVSCSP